MAYKFNPFTGNFDYYESGSSSAPEVTYVYFGDPDTDGSWRITTSGSNLVQERRESGVWVEKVAATP